MSKDKRKQPELRKAVDGKLEECYDIIAREPIILMRRGTRKISLRELNGIIIISNE